VSAGAGDGAGVRVSSGRAGAVGAASPVRRKRRLSRSIRSAPVFCTLNSTRRLRARPASVVFGAIGFEKP